MSKDEMADKSGNKIVITDEEVRKAMHRVDQGHKAYTGMLRDKIKKPQVDPSAPMKDRFVAAYDRGDLNGHPAGAIQKFLEGRTPEQKERDAREGALPYEPKGGWNR